MMDSIREWVNFAANICILLITLYTFYITFLSKKINVLSIGTSSSATKGESISVVIENKTFSSLVVNCVYLIINRQYKILLQCFSEPLVLPPFAAKRIESDKYTFLMPNIDLSLTNKDCTVEIVTTRKVLFLSFLHQKKSLSFFQCFSAIKDNKKMKYMTVNVSMEQCMYNGKIIPFGARFSLNIWKDDFRKTVFVFGSGKLSESIFGRTGLPQEVVHDEKTLNEYLIKQLSSDGYHFIIKEWKGIPS